MKDAFNPANEVLHGDTQGTGLIHAPRAFSFKLRQVTQTIGLESSYTRAGCATPAGQVAGRTAIIVTELA